MRIGIDARFYGTVGKGLGRYTEKLIEYLEKIDSENEYVIFLRKENYHEYTPRRTTFRKVLADYPWYGWTEQLLFPFQIRKYHLDLIHFPHFNVPLFVTTPFVVTIHDLILLHYPTVRGTTRPKILYAIKYLVYRCVIANAIRRARRVIAVSRFTEQDIIREYHSAAGKMRVTLEGVEKHCFLVPPDSVLACLQRVGLLGAGGISDLSPFVLYVGNAYPHKDLETILDMAALYPHLYFVLVGKRDFFYERIINEANKRKLSNILFPGFLSDEELSVLYRYARVYFFPSRYEGFGLPPLEALLYGTPVLARRAAALPEILDGAATFFDDSRRQGAHDLLRGMISEKPPLSAFWNMVLPVLSRYDWGGMAQETIEVYHSAVTREERI